MTENQVGYLFNIASKLSSNNDSLKKLKSYYLMRCNEITKRRSKLPAKQFSQFVRCPHCYSEWARGSEVKIKPIKLTKGQCRKIIKQTKNSTDQQKYEMHKNEIIQTCTFCHKNTTLLLTKPRRNYIKFTSPTTVPRANSETKSESKAVETKKSKRKKELTISMPQNNNDFIVNLYTNTHDIFLLKNDKNTLSSTTKPATKVIKNNKKRKDKFAGLCQKAVLASAKLKQEKEESAKKTPDNKLSLFLKPSLG